ARTIRAPESGPRFRPAAPGGPHNGWRHPDRDARHAGPARSASRAADRARTGAGSRARDCAAPDAAGRGARGRLLNAHPSEVQPTWTWSGADEVVLDTRAPAISEVRIRSGRVEIELTEEVVAASAAATVTIDGEPTTWQLAEDRYTLRPLAEVSPGGHTV